jgi:tetratricopeptide (TPR) repeat protein
MKTSSEIVVASLDAEELTALARIDMEKGALDHALIKIKQALSQDGKHTDALGMGGRIYAQLGLFNKARVMFEKYLEHRPGSSLETFQYGMVQFDMGQKAEALSTWTELLSKEPNHPPALFFKSVVLAEQGRDAEARQTIDQILKNVSTDNLYIGKAKDLLRVLDSGARTLAKNNTQAYGALDKTTH